jgi:translation elongation factor EF-G
MTAKMPEPPDMERIMAVAVRVPIDVPHETICWLIEEIHARRGEVTAIERHLFATLVGATIPARKLGGFDRDLARISAGRASHEVVFSHFQRLPLGEDPDNFPPAVGMRA